MPLFSNHRHPLALDHAGSAGGTHPPTADPSAPLLFEVAWEVCSQTGGIYTVLRSKAPATVGRWGDQYCLLGPYHEVSARVELELQQPEGPIAQALEALEVGGVKAYFGRWLVTGRPQVVLFDIQSVMPRVADYKYLLWKDCGLDSPGADHEYDEIVALGHLVSEFLALIHRQNEQRPIIAHFHEWQGAAAVPLLDVREVKLASVFTTHATLVGRALAAANADLYGQLHHVDGGAVAAEHGFGHRHRLECAAAHRATLFTTVSGITALEAEHFIGRKPDTLLPNGVNVERFAAPHEHQELHQRSKEKINQFVMGHFFPSYSFDLDNTLYFFISGRYEFRNKGIDLFIEALSELRNRLRADDSPITVVAFIITRAPYRGFNNETLNRQAMFNELRETCDEVTQGIGKRLFNRVARGQMPEIDDLLDEYASVRLKRMMYAHQQHSAPTIVTHDLHDDAGDPVLNHLRYRGLFNYRDDPVKVIFHPEFISATSPTFACDYSEFVHGCHLGVFPSYYEPWGYTPLECVVRGIPAVTSDLSGFGNYVREKYPDHEKDGILVCERGHGNFSASVHQVANWLHDFAKMSRRERIDQRNQVERYADQFDWHVMGRHYVDAYQESLTRAYGDWARVPPEPEAPRPPREVPTHGPDQR